VRQAPQLRLAAFDAAFGRVAGTRPLVQHSQRRRRPVRPGGYARTQDRKSWFCRRRTGTSNQHARPSTPEPRLVPPDRPPAQSTATLHRDHARLGTTADVPPPITIVLQRKGHCNRVSPAATPGRITGSAPLGTVRLNPPSWPAVSPAFANAATSVQGLRGGRPRGRRALALFPAHGGASSPDRVLRRQQPDPTPDVIQSTPLPTRTGTLDGTFGPRLIQNLSRRPAPDGCGFPGRGSPQRPKWCSPNGRDLVPGGSTEPAPVRRVRGVHAVRPRPRGCRPACGHQDHRTRTSHAPCWSPLPFARRLKCRTADPLCISKVSGEHAGVTHTIRALRTPASLPPEPPTFVGTVNANLHPWSTTMGGRPPTTLQDQRRMGRSPRPAVDGNSQNHR